MPLALLLTLLLAGCGQRGDLYRPTEAPAPAEPAPPAASQPGTPPPTTTEQQKKEQK